MALGRRLGIAALVLGTLGSGLWLIGAETTERLTTGWLEARAASGWQVSYANLETGGYPSRFETQATDLLLSDPATGWAWSAPDFTLIQPLTRLNSVQAIWPSEQSLASPFARWQISADTFEANGGINPLADFALLDGTLDLAGLRIENNSGGALVLETGTLQLTRQGTEDQGFELYALNFDMAALDPGAVFSRLLDPAGVLPDAIETARIEAELAFDRPWDLSALERDRPQPRRIELDEASADWGDLRFRSTGSLEIDAEGIPEGRLTIRAENWRRMLDMAENSGRLPPDLRRIIETPLALIGGATGDPEDIDAPLIFRNGRMVFGPFPLGPAPRIVLR